MPTQPRDEANRHFPAGFRLGLVALLTEGIVPVLTLLVATTAGLFAPPLRPEQMAMMPEEMPQMVLSRIMWPDQVTPATVRKG